MNYFAFIDETGTNLNDRFFGVGILTVPQVSELYDKLRPISDQIRDLSKANKQQRIDKLFAEKKFDELLSLAKGGRSFELKYDRISNSNKHLFKNLIKEYFTVKDARFTAIMVDKKNPSFKPTKVFPGTWSAYITYACIAIEREYRNLAPTTLITILDEISKEKGISETLESAIKNKFEFSCKKKNINKGNLICSRAESNSHILIQLVDILLGCVAFDYKRRNKLLSEDLIDRKILVVQEIIDHLERKDLKGDFTARKYNYFSVWEMNWK